MFKVPASSEWVREAHLYQGMVYRFGESGFAVANELEWFEVSNYPISRLIDATDKNWLDAECQMWADEGYPQRYNDIISQDIVDPIIVYDDGNNGYTWDGFHRIAATIVKGKTTIKAVVGIHV